MDEREYQGTEEEIDLLELCGVLLRNWKVILITTLVAAVMGFAGSKLLLTPQYEASVNMIVNSRQDASNGNLTNDNITSARNLVSTYAIIIKSNTVLEKVISRLHLDMDYLELYDVVEVEAVDSTQVMQISARDPDPEQARAIVEQIARISPDVIVDAVEAGSCKVISNVAVGENPVSPSTLKNTAIVAMLGFALGVGIIVLKELLQNYIKDDADVLKYLDLPVLGVIPEIEEVK